jgi:NAD dependent epimerase/dehydratase family enzyme
VFGRGERGNFTRLAKALKGHYFFFPGGSETRKASGYVKDATRSLIFFAEKDIRQIVYNFSFPKNYTIGEICDTFCQIAKYANPISLPVAKVGKVLSTKSGPLGSLGQRLLKLVFPTNIAPAKLQEFGFRWRYDLESALNDWNQESRFDQKA